jgi:signal transduction histidine kinase
MRQVIMTLKNITRTIFQPPSSEMAEEQYRGVIFNYFLVTVWVLAIINTLQNLYVALFLETQPGEDYADYTWSNITFVVILGLLWWGHRFYPRLVRHIFISLMIVVPIFLFDLQDVNALFFILTIPILMAAFLIKPVYSFVYYIIIIALYIFRLFLEGLSVGEQTFPFISFIGLLIFAAIAWLIAQALDRALAEARALNRELDQRVQERTQELAQALRREHTLAVRNKTILESIADGVLVFSADQQVVMANPAANRIARRNLDSLSLTDFLYTIEDKAREIIQPWLSSKKPDDITNVRFEWYDRTISASVAPVILPGSGTDHIAGGRVMVLRDFTREAELERAKDLFLGMVSHELRTPMAAIQGYVDVLLVAEKDNVSPEGYEYLKIISVSVKELLQLANELIDLSRMETGEVELYRQWVEVSDIVNGATKIVQQEFSKRNLSLAVTIEDDLPEFYVDRNRINQVLLNLLSNAYKYTNEGGATVNVTQENAWITIAIGDTGIGIKPSDQNKLFERFFRAEDRTVQKAGGTGLGLSISKGLVELHGGELAFESTYGVGTTFTVKLPLQQ